MSDPTTTQTDCVSLDISKPEDARTYIEHFNKNVWLGKPITFVLTTEGRTLYLDRLTDEEAIDVANMLYEIECQAEMQRDDQNVV